MLVIYLLRFSYVLGKLFFVVEVSLVIVIFEEMVEMEKRNELRFRIKEEYFVVL